MVRKRHLVTDRFEVMDEVNQKVTDPESKCSQYCFKSLAPIVVSSNGLSCCSLVLGCLAVLLGRKGHLVAHKGISHISHAVICTEDSGGGSRQHNIFFLIFCSTQVS